LIALQCCPLGKGVVSDEQLLANRMDTRYGVRDVLGQPVPKRRAKIEAIVLVLGLNEHVGVDEAGGQLITPISCPSLLKVSDLLMPSIQNASL